MKLHVLSAHALALSALLFVAPAQAQPCIGDCNRDREVTVNEVISGVSIALGNVALDQCPAADCNRSGEVTIDCVVGAVNVALSGCFIGICGNGVREADEECDDGNDDAFDGCTASCTICGNGTVVPPEECDDGNRSTNDACTNACLRNVCGDGSVDPVAEECDDGNNGSCDGCSATCRSEGVCGDGVVDTNCEQCDDGNTADADGCRSGCVLNICGDGVRNPAAEQCDDANVSSCDGCSAACQIETGFCGDGALDANCEQCDDGNTSDGDACRNNCTAADVPGRIGAGPISALIIDPRTPTTLYTRAECGGVLKSTDGAATWSAAASGLPANASQPYTYPGGPLAIDPVMSSTLYAAGFGASAMFKSTNGGSSWGVAGAGLPSENFLSNGALAVDPRMPSTVYAGGLGVYGSDLFKSSDGASSWIDTGLHALQAQYINDLVIDPVAPTTLYAAAQLPHGVLKSTDGGSTWRAITTGLPDQYLDVLAIDPLTPSTLYAATFGSVFKSTDAGATWSAATVGLPNTYVNALAIDPLTPSTLFAGTGCGGEGGVFKSTDAGTSWKPANTRMPAIAALVIDPGVPSTLYAASQRAGALYKSTDGGDTWRATGLAGAPRCGDGVRCGFEECDDGNAVDGDGCDSNCTTTRCTNGVVSAGEECDDGNGRSCDGCSKTCQRETGFCGDGVLYADCELCDDGNTSNADACRADCQPNICGDGFLNPAAEQCDDGNRLSGDGCDRNCMPTACGNGIVTAGEECDDGNTTPCDGCTPECRIQRCGDGHLDVACGEQCDDGNANPFDGCTDGCTICGDGRVTPPEECDDGNTDPADGCTAACTRCGNGTVTAPEVCDDGNLLDGDDCDATCTTTGCGNAIVQGDEECDDGNNAGGDGCAANCTRESVRYFPLDATQSSLLIESQILRIPLPLSGWLSLRSGSSRAGAPAAPLSMQVEDLHLDPISVSSLACLCVRMAPDPSPESANAAAGRIACGDDGLRNVDVATSIDHSIDDIDPVCAHGTYESALCVDGICDSGSSGGFRCNDDSDCAPEHPGVCNGATTTFSGVGPSGSAVLDLDVVTWAIAGGCAASALDERTGTDRIPCTADDPMPRSTYVPTGMGGGLSFLPPRLRVQLTTGTAEAEIVDADVTDTIIMTAAAGKPLECSTSGVRGGALAGAFGVLDNHIIGDTVNTLVLALGAPLCAGDCDTDGTVTIDEVVTGVSIALGTAPIEDCPEFACHGSNEVSVDCLIQGVSAVLDECVRSDK